MNRVLPEREWAVSLKKMDMNRDGIGRAARLMKSEDGVILERATKSVYVR